MTPTGDKSLALSHRRPRLAERIIGLGPYFIYFSRPSTDVHDLGASCDTRPCWKVRKINPTATKTWSRIERCRWATVIYCWWRRIATFISILRFRGSATHLANRVSYLVRGLSLSLNAVHVSSHRRDYHTPRRRHPRYPETCEPVLGERRTIMLSRTSPPFRESKIARKAGKRAGKRKEK